MMLFNLRFQCLSWLFLNISKFASSVSLPNLGHMHHSLSNLDLLCDYPSWIHCVFTQSRFPTRYLIWVLCSTTQSTCFVALPNLGVLHFTQSGSTVSSRNISFLNPYPIWVLCGIIQFGLLDLLPSFPPLRRYLAWVPCVGI